MKKNDEFTTAGSSWKKYWNCTEAYLGHRITLFTKNNGKTNYENIENATFENS